MKKKLVRIVLILIAICMAIFFRMLDYAFESAIAYVQKYHQEKQERASCPFPLPEENRRYGQAWKRNFLYPPDQQGDCPQ